MLLFCTGTCLCNDGWGGHDCSVQFTTPTIDTDTANTHIKCDGECPRILISGSNFALSPLLLCVFQAVTVSVNYVYEHEPPALLFFCDTYRIIKTFHFNRQCFIIICHLKLHPSTFYSMFDCILMIWYLKLYADSILKRSLSYTYYFITIKGNKGCVDHHRSTYYVCCCLHRPWSRSVCTARSKGKLCHQHPAAWCGLGLRSHCTQLWEWMLHMWLYQQYLL